MASPGGALAYVVLGTLRHWHAAGIQSRSLAGVARTFGATQPKLIIILFLIRFTV
jgi:hypothetical protein